ncbi:MAG: hypothetical protein BGO26_19570 [Actinobacteria bacterium 69-20]|jgi:prevent-host-death family protein|nr:type II toxin-antitoxin system Phd/YefM family antitoxin [Actinomycetota bacterium]OJV24733.1 MAG: hypothetical protein BGO26_19570 [Actinobacteria bacterium 69-20]
MTRWQVQTAKQRLSELLRAAHEAGPQVVTRHGEDVAVVMDIADFRALTVEVPDFKDFLRSAPIDGLDVRRDRTPAPVMEFAAELAD